jgi:sec-independent protein translocase protein TatC
MLETVSEADQPKDFTDTTTIEDVSETALAIAEQASDDNSLDEIDDVEMSLFDHLEELRSRIFYALIAIIIGIVGCFAVVNKIVALLEIPAQGVKFLQLAPGEYFFVSLKVAGYSGLLVFGSSILFVLGIVFAYQLLIPAALNFFISYGGDVVEQFWSIDRYFEFVLLLLFSTGLAFQIPVIQALLALTGIVNSARMLAGWRYVVLGAVILGAVLTPSTDPMTQSLLAGAVGILYFGGIFLVKAMGK